jgi:tetrahydromethanopterin S-methyltransferase subunit E
MEIYLQGPLVLLLVGGIVGVAIGAIGTFVGLVFLGDRLERERKQRIWRHIEEQVAGNGRQPRIIE